MGAQPQLAQLFSHAHHGVGIGQHRPGLLQALAGPAGHLVGVAVVGFEAVLGNFVLVLAAHVARGAFGLAFGLGAELRAVEQGPVAVLLALQVAHERQHVVGRVFVDGGQERRADGDDQVRGVADQDNGRFWNYKDFNKFTPGLERMFAPSMSQRDWY